MSDARQPPSLLVVDDNELNRLLASSLGESLGFEVHTACDGVEALDVCRRHAPALVLMDVWMPRMNGIDATQRLRELQHGGEMAHFPILAATSDASPQSREQCLAAGMDGFLAKPLRRSTLLGEMQRVATGLVQGALTEVAQAA